jgi:hypothetical protein
VENLIGIGNLWEGGSLEEAFRTWCNKKETSKIRALPLNIVWGVWLAKNLKLFEDKETLPLKCVVQGHKYLKCLSIGAGKSYPHKQGEVAINKIFHGIFLMVLHKGTLLREVQEAYYTYLQINIFLLKVELVKKPIIYEMMALKLVLKLAQEFGVTQLQFFGDSMLVIQWMHEEITFIKFYITTLV